MSDTDPPAYFIEFAQEAWEQGWWKDYTHGLAVTKSLNFSSRQASLNARS
jgi:hypothetical protein